MKPVAYIPADGLRRIAAFPSTATELQDRVTMLECQLLARHEPPNVGIEPPERSARMTG